MGLGKTIQAIAFLGFLQHMQSIPGPFLVVVPLSTLPNWEAEFEKWLPDCNVVVYAGDGKSRAIIRQYELFSAEADGAPKFNVLLTTFEIILKDREHLSQISWEHLVVDEAHRLKNADSALHDVLDGFSTRCRMLITGTPLQNSLKELWALMHFIEPEKFPSLAFFEQKYGQLSHEGQIGQLHSELKPHLLRRLKRDVEKSLPAKNEKILRVPLSALQRQYYRWVLTRNFKELNRGLTGQSATTLSNIMIELKKVCNHPYLFSNAEDSHGKSMYPDLSPPEALIANSGKMLLLDQLLRHLHAGGHRVLIFSQMVRMLDLISDFVGFRGYPYQRLDGSSTRIQRQRAMESFNAPNSRDFCFLLSTRAGGLGINLSTADTVIIFDSDWNPQNDLQAEARAHRIGQKNVVSIYRLVSRNTVEENILARAKKKLALDQLVIQRLNANSDQTETKGQKPMLLSGISMDSQWQKSELADVIRFGAQEIFKSENDKVAELELRSMDMEAILGTSEDAADPAEQDTDMMGNFKFSEFKLNPSNSSSSSSTPTLSQSGSAVDGFWETVIPVEERSKEVESQRTEEPLGPRRARQKSKNFDSSPGRRQYASEMEPPAAKRVKLGDDEEEAAQEPQEAGNDTFSTKFVGGYGASLDGKQIKKLVAAIKSVGDLTRLVAISQAAGVDSTKSIEEVHAVVCELVTECRKAALSCGEKKRVLLFYQGHEVNVTLLLSRVDDFQLLKTVLYDAPDPMATLIPLLSDVKPWKLGLRSSWQTPTDDARLLIGIYFHGCGSYDALANDQNLGLARVLTGNSAKLQQSQLLSRFESLMRFIRNSRPNTSTTSSVAGTPFAAASAQTIHLIAPPTAPVARESSAATDSSQFQQFTAYMPWDPSFSTGLDTQPVHQPHEAMHGGYLVEHLLNSTDAPPAAEYPSQQGHMGHHGDHHSH
jgi:chromodomain-helicase-DNA-binding protein 1